MANTLPITSSLFGISPESLQAQRQAVQEAQAMRFAQLDPSAQAQYGFFRAGQQAGTGLSGLLGGADPELEAVKLVQSLGAQYDKTTPEGLGQLAQALQATGNPYAQQFAIQASDRAQKLLTTQTEMGLKRAQASKALSEGLTTEQRNASGLADTKAQRGTPEWAKIYNEELARLTTKAEGRPLIKEIGVAEGTREPVYTYQEGNGKPQQVVYKNVNGEQVMVPYTGGVDRTTAKVTASANSVGETEFSKKLAGLDAGRLDDALKIRDSSVAALSSLNKLASLDDAGLIGGTFASGRVGATNLLQTLGLASPADIKLLSNSQEYQKVAGDVILQTLGGKLGAGFSNEDRKFIQGLIPQLETSPQARRQLINFMRDKNIAIVEEVQRMDDYARERNSLKGYRPTIPLAPSVAPSGLANMTTEQLKAEIARQKGNK